MNINRALRVASAILLLFCTNTVSAQSSHSWGVTVARPDSVIFLDTATVARQGDQVTTWELIVYQTPLDILPIRGIDHAIKRYVYDCQARTIDFDYYTDFDLSGGVLYASRSSPDPMPVAPNSLGEQRWDQVCGAGKVSGLFPDTLQAVSAAKAWFASPKR